jgi:hypothetical protein
VTDQLDPKISLITKLLLVVLSPAAAEGEWSNAFEALQRTLKEVDPGGHGLVERLKTPATPPLSQDDLREAYSIGYQDCAKEIEQRRSSAIAVTAPRTPETTHPGAELQRLAARDHRHCVLNKHLLTTGEAQRLHPGKGRSTEQSTTHCQRSRRRLRVAFS